MICGMCSPYYRIKVRVIKIHLFHLSSDKPTSSCRCFMDIWPPPRSRIVLEKLKVAQLANKFPCFCGTKRFITVFTQEYATSFYEECPYPRTRKFIVVFTKADHYSLLQARSNYFIPSECVFMLPMYVYVLILHSYLK